MLDRPAYPPIGDHALLADCHSSALVTRDGTIDWACMRRFDGPSVFAAILDDEVGGHFALRARDVTRRRWDYVDGSLVLETTLTTDTGTARVRDAFAMRRGGRADPAHLLLRLVDGLDGRVTFDVEITPRFDYGAVRPWLRRRDDGCWAAIGGEDGLVIVADVDLDGDLEHDVVTSTFEVAAGERRRMALRASASHVVDPTATSVDDVDDHLEDTIAWWQHWSSHTVVPGHGDDAVRRSATVLKGLTCAPTGAIVAAPTTSLPEVIGGERNWDYRYTWVRDAVLTIEALAMAGHPDVAREFRHFLLRSTAGSVEELQIMYGPYGASRLPELELELAGYRDSTPVRIGNGAAQQVQLDVYGHVLGATYVWQQGRDEPVAQEQWWLLAEAVEAACEHWRDQDQGLWEMRGPPRHFVESKAMCWVAIDRGIKLAEQDGREDAPLDHWREVRDEIRDTVLRDGLDPTGTHFVQSFGAEHTDASLLRLSAIGFIEPDDPRMRATVAAVRDELAIDDDATFLLRYSTELSDDGLAGEEATFLLCSFWLVEALALQGDVDEAEELFERLCASSNDLGLVAEEYDVASGELLGNFPQAFTHLGVIRSAFRLAEARGELDLTRAVRDAEEEAAHDRAG